MNGQAGELPCVQFFYREGRQLRAIALPGEVWFSAADVINQFGHAVDERNAASLLTALGIPCRAVPCMDGAEEITLWCITEGSLMRMFDKMERFAAKERHTA
jgi:hypothetical protein